MWSETKSYLDEYCRTECDIEPNPYAGCNKIINYAKFLKTPEFEAKRYHNFRQRKFPSDFLIYDLGFITELMPEIMYKIAKIYERLQLNYSFLNHITEYSIYTNSRKKLILSFYDFVRYSFMNYKKKFSLKEIITDMGFVFKIKN
jgi:hypothetical protein